VSTPEGLGRALEALAPLAPDEWLRRRAAAQALAGEYDWDAVAAAYEDLYGAVRRRWTAEAGTIPGAVPR
jgi:glycosyltransferase involved in cell wall biosynthesis